MLPLVVVLLLRLNIRWANVEAFNEVSWLLSPHGLAPRLIFLSD